MNTKNEETGILLVGHGSSLPYNKELLDTLSEKIENNLPGYAIEVGFMQFTQPTISQAVNNLKKTGITKIIVQPVFLADGIHTRVDIRKQLGLKPLDTEIPIIEGIENNKKIRKTKKREIIPVDFDGEIIYLNPLGPDDIIVNIIKERVDKYLYPHPKQNITKLNEVVGEKII